MNPYAIIIGLVILGGALFGAERWGEDRGIALQAQSDQIRFDKIQRDLDAQKATANKLMADAAAHAAEDAQRAATLHQQQELAHENDQARTDDARRRGVDAGRLRFAAADPGRGAGGRSAVPSTADAAGPAPAPAVELSDAASSALRELAFECDRLADDYRAAYRFLYPGWEQPVIPPAASAAEPPPATIEGNS